MVAAHEAGGDDADDAWVPAFRGDDESCGVVFGGEAVGEFLGFVLDAVFDVLTFAVLAVEGGGQGGGAGWVGAEEEVEGSVGAVESAGGVEAGAEAEAEVHAVEWGADAGDFDEGAEAWSGAAFELFEAFADEEPVFGDEGDDVGDGGEGDEVELGFEVEVFCAAAFAHGVGEFEDDASGAEVVEGVAEFRIDEGGADGGAGGVGFVVVEDDDLDAALGEPCGFGFGGGAAVDGDEEVDGAFVETALEAVGGEPVAFFHAEREEAAWGEPVGDEDRAEEC